MRTLAVALYLAALAAPVAGCVGEDDKAPEEELDGLDLDESKADTQRNPTFHGSLIWDVKSDAVLSDAERFHAWTFELSGDAKVDLRTTYTVLGQRRTDTVLYLYKQQADGKWGSYIARNDDYGNTSYSRLNKSLDAGNYRIIVKGALASTTGKFSVQPTCTGDGCTVVDPDRCLFGDSYNDLRSSAELTQTISYKITPANLSTVPAEFQRRLVVAVQQSSHTDVMTPTEALDAVDQNEANFIYYVDPVGRRNYTSFEYGVGDNSYGGVFDDATGELASSIHDGDLEACTARHTTCLLPEDWSALRTDAAFTKGTSRVVTASTTLTATEQAQALAALKQAYPDVTTAAAGIGRADDHELNIVAFTHAATGKQIEVFEFGAGDTSIGAIFTAGTTDRVGTISDLTISACALNE